MPAFVQKFKNFDVSINYDGITFYPKVDMGESPGFKIAMKDCKAYLTFTVGYITNEGKNFSQSCDSFKSTIGDYRNIHRDNDDHDYYHQDNLNLDDDHYHFKFPSMLTREHLKNVINILANNGLLTIAEQENFLLEYDNRIQSVRYDLNLALSKNMMSFDQLSEKRVADTKTIMEHIAQCNDNEILVDLHRYLQSEQFNYLRILPSSSSPSQVKWQGTDMNGVVVQTSELWAMIEKNIAYQMAHNVEENVSKFSRDVSLERAQQLNQHAFFGIKRKQNVITPQNKMYDTFRQGNIEEFDRRYEKQLVGKLFIENQGVALSSVIKEMKKLNYSKPDIDNLKKNINFQKKDGTTLLFIAVCYNQMDLVKALVNAGADVNLNNPKNVSPLFMAAEKGYPELVEYLIGKGADVNAKHSNYWTPILVAAQNKHIDIVNLLIKNNAIFDANDSRMRAISSQLIEKPGTLNVKMR